LATSRNTSFTGVRHECAASANIDADPVTTAAIDFATPTSTLAPRAIHTSSHLQTRPERDARESKAREI